MKIKTKKLDETDQDYRERYIKYDMAESIYTIDAPEEIGGSFVKVSNYDFFLYKSEYTVIEEASSSKVQHMYKAGQKIKIKELKNLDDAYEKLYERLDLPGTIQTVLRATKARIEFKVGKERVSLYNWECTPVEEQAPPKTTLKKEDLRIGQKIKAKDLDRGYTSRHNLGGSILTISAVQKYTVETTENHNLYFGEFDLVERLVLFQRKTY